MAVGCRSTRLGKRLWGPFRSITSIQSGRKPLPALTFSLITSCSTTRRPLGILWGCLLCLASICAIVSHIITEMLRGTVRNSGRKLLTRASECPRRFYTSSGLRVAADARQNALSTHRKPLAIVSHVSQQSRRYAIAAEDTNKGVVSA